MSDFAVVFPSSYNRARPWLIGQGLYAIAGSLGGIFFKEMSMKNMAPALELVEKYTGLPRLVASNLTEDGLFVQGMAFSLGIGMLYLLLAGPMWNRGGKAMVEASITWRFIYAAIAYDAVGALIFKQVIGISWGNLIFGTGVKGIVVPKKK
ncbi:hypothetical protein ABKN59_002146 [Abortiporus biennis]